METLQILASRKSVRSYLPQAVEQDKLDAVVAAGNQAPNAGPFQMAVVRDQAYLKQINAAALSAMKNSGNDFLMERAALDGYQPLYGAPVMIVLSAPSEGYGQVNVACAATNMTIAATALGLGSCYVVTPTLALDGKNELSGKLNLPEGFIPLCAVLLGYEGNGGFSSPREKVDNVNYV